MKKAMYKYVLPEQEVFSLDLPVGAKIYHAGMQGSSYCIWAEVNVEEQRTLTRQFKLLATGEVEERMDVSYLGTFIENGGEYVYHLYEVELEQRRLRERELKKGD